MRVVMCSDSHCRIRVVGRLSEASGHTAMGIITTKFRLPR